MTLEINKLINSDYSLAQKIGWLLYNREDQDGGLTKEEVYGLLKAMNSLEDEMQKAYNEGFNDALNY